MELQEVLKRLDFTIMKAKELKPEQFNYSAYVWKFDKENKCGSVCCIVGHYPNWGIKDFYYCPKSDDFLRFRAGKVSTGLLKYHGLSIRLIDFLFFGDVIEHPFFEHINYKASIFFTLPEVIERFEYVRKLLASGEITPNQEY